MNVYILKAGPFFKIGKANNIKARVLLMQTGCPLPIECIAFLKHELPYTIESKLHQHYQKQRGIGEWFVLSKVDFQNIVTTYNFTVCCQEIKWDNSPKNVESLSLKQQKATVLARVRGLWIRYSTLYEALSAIYGGGWIGPYKLSCRAYLAVKIRESLKDIVEIGIFSNSDEKRRINKQLENFELDNGHLEGVLKSIAYLDKRKR